MCSNRILKLVLRRCDHYASLCVTDNLHSNIQELEETLVLPSSEVIVKVRTTVNQLPITRQTESGLFEALQYVFSASSWWSELGYTVSDVLTDNEEQIAFRLRCTVTADIHVDLSCAIDAVELHFKELSELSLDFDFSTENQVLQIRSILEMLEYQLVSLMLNLEMRYPFVFGFHGRQLLKQSFWYVRRSVELINSPEPEITPHLISIPAKPQAFKNNLLLLQERALAEYNTLNIMKESECKKKRATTYNREALNNRKKHQNLEGNIITRIKALPFSLAFLNLQAVLEHLANGNGRALIEDS